MIFALCRCWYRRATIYMISSLSRQWISSCIQPLIALITLQCMLMCFSYSYTAHYNSRNASVLVKKNKDYASSAEIMLLLNCWLMKFISYKFFCSPLCFLLLYSVVLSLLRKNLLSPLRLGYRRPFVFGENCVYFDLRGAANTQ